MVKIRNKVGGWFQKLTALEFPIHISEVTKICGDLLEVFFRLAKLEGRLGR